MVKSRWLRVQAAGLLLLAAGACGRTQGKQIHYCPERGVFASSITDTTVVRVTPGRGRMSEHLQVWLHRPAAGTLPADLQLFIDGHPIPGTPGSPARQIGSRCALLDAKGTLLGFQEVFEFVPARSEQSRAAWAHLLGSPESFVDSVRVGMGPVSGPEFKARPRSTVIPFTVVSETGFWIACAALLAALWLLVWAGVRTTILRDSGEPPPAPAKRPFSLARVVMAMWTLLVLGGFFGIWMITGDHRGVLTTQALLLMGIVSVSGAASATLTRNQNHQRNEQIREMRVAAEVLNREASAPGASAARVETAQSMEAQLRTEEAKVPASRGFFADLLSDENGPTIHRYQNLIWNLGLAGVFVVECYRTLALPEFDGDVMLLLGISQALYLGLKLPEQAKPPVQGNPNPPAGSRLKRLLTR